MNKLEYIPGDLVIYASLIKEPVAKICEVHEASYTVKFMHGNFAETSKGIKPITLTPEILEKNGWRTQNRWYYYLDVAEGFISYIGIDFKHKSNKGHLYVEVNENNMVEIQYCHELQHFLFGLGLNHEMEVCRYRK